VRSEAAPAYLDVEMETGTGKTTAISRPCSTDRRLVVGPKFIVVVPALAIREGLKKEHSRHD